MNEISRTRTATRVLTFHSCKHSTPDSHDTSAAPFSPFLAGFSS